MLYSQLDYSSDKMNAFMATAGRKLGMVKPARVATNKNDVAITKPAYTIKKSGEIVFKDAPTQQQSPYSTEIQHTPSNKRLVELNSKIDAAKSYLATITEDTRSLRSFIVVITKANQSLKKVVLARNPSALDVLGVFSEFKIPGELTDISGETGVADHTRTRVYDSVYKNAVRDFAGFVNSKGYVLAGANSNDYSGIATEDIANIITGIRAGRTLKKKYEIKSVLEAIKTASGLETEIEQYTKSIAEMTEEQVKFARNNRSDIKMNVPVESIVNQREQCVRKANQVAQDIESDITNLTSKIKMYRDLGNLSVTEVMHKVTELEAGLEAIKTEYQKLAEEARSRRASGDSRIRKVLDLQKEAFDRKYAEKQNQLQGRYARLDPQEAQKRIKKELAAWSKIEKEEIEARNAERGYKLDPLAAQETNTKTKQLADMLAKIESASEELKIMKQASRKTATERKQEADFLSGMMAQKKAELKNASKRIKTKEEQLRSELDEDNWVAEINEKLDDPVFRAQALRHHPINYLAIALRSGSDKRTQNLMNLAWSYHKRSRLMPKALTKTSKFNAVHFGSKGFVVDPRFPGLNSQLVMVIDEALRSSLLGLDTEELKPVILAGLMDSLAKTPEALENHKSTFNNAVSTVNKWLSGKKSRTIITEIVEELVANKAISLPGDKKPTRKYIETVVDNMLTVIKNSGALHKLGSFTWPSYREETNNWVRNTFKVEMKVKKETK